MARLDGGSGGGAVDAIVDLAAKVEPIFALMTHLALDADGPNEEELLGLARGVFAALRCRGRRVRPRGFTDYVWRALGEVLPDAPGVRWDGAWADDLARRAVAHVARRIVAHVGGIASDELDRAHDEVVAAAEAEDRRRYRQALREWTAAVRTVTANGSSPAE